MKRRKGVSLDPSFALSGNERHWTTLKTYRFSSINLERYWNRKSVSQRGEERKNKGEGWEEVETHRVGLSGEGRGGKNAGGSEVRA